MCVSNKNMYSVKESKLGIELKKDFKKSYCIHSAPRKNAKRSIVLEIYDILLII